MLRLSHVVSVLVTFASPVWAGSVSIEPPFDQAGQVGKQAGPGYIADLLTDPAHVQTMADALSEPEFMSGALAMSVSPEAWMKQMAKAADRSASRIPSSSANQEMLSDWFYSSIDPQYQQAVLSRLLDPIKPQRWMQAMSDPRFYMNALAVMNPATPMQWMKVTADGRLQKSMHDGFDPKSCMNWMRLQAGVSKASEMAARPNAFTWRPVQRY